MKRLSETIGRIGCAASVFKEPSSVAALRGNDPIT